MASESRFSVKDAALKLRGKAVFQRRDVALREGKPVPINGNGQPA